MVDKARITKSIRINPTLNKMLDKYCNLEQETQANYINKLLWNDLNSRTLERDTLPNHYIFLTLPIGEQNIKECLTNCTDLRTYEQEPNYKEMIKINNYLDVWKYGTYQSPVNKSTDNDVLHNGLILLKKDNVNYFVFLEYINPNFIVSVHLIDEAKAIELTKIADNPELTRTLDNFINNRDYVVSMGIDKIDLTEEQGGIFTSTLAEKSKENKELKAEIEKLKGLCSSYENEIETLKNKNESLRNDILKEIEIKFENKINELFNDKIKE